MYYYFGTYIRKIHGDMGLVSCFLAFFITIRHGLVLTGTIIQDMEGINGKTEKKREHRT